jgi:hypothetical protein
MEPMLIININWEFFLGVIGTLVILAYYANGRFTKLETSVEWLKDAIKVLTQRNEAATRVRESRPRFLRQAKTRTR